MIYYLFVVNFSKFYKYLILRINMIRKDLTATGLEYINTDKALGIGGRLPYNDVVKVNYSSGGLGFENISLISLLNHSSLLYTTPISVGKNNLLKLLKGTGSDILSSSYFPSGFSPLVYGLELFGDVKKDIRKVGEGFLLDFSGYKNSDMAKKEYINSIRRSISSNSQIELEGRYILDGTEIGLDLLFKSFEK